MGKKGDPKMKSYAAYLKDHGVQRLTAQCPICYGTYKIGKEAYAHFRLHG